MRNMKVLLITFFFFLIGRAPFIMNYFYMVRRSIKVITACHEVFERGSIKKEVRSTDRQNLDAASLQCTCRHSLLICDILAKHMMAPVPQQPDAPEMAPADFSVPKVEIHSYQLPVQTIEDTKENSLWDMHAIPGCIKKLKNTLGAMHQQQIWRRQV